MLSAASADVDAAAVKRCVFANHTTTLNRQEFRTPVILENAV